MKLLLIAFMLLLSSCGPVKDSQGNYWKANKFWKRATAHKENHLSCPVVKK